MTALIAWCQYNPYQKDIVRRNLPRSTLSKGLPLPKIMCSPACLKASSAVHSAISFIKRQTREATTKSRCLEKSEI